LTIDNGDSLDISAARTLTVVRNAARPSSGNISNSGSILLSATAFDDTTLRLDGDVTLQGAGTVTMSNTLLLRNRIFGTASTDRLTHAAGHTIQGSGEIGHNQMKLTNQGLIVANQSAGITIDPTDGADGVINTGTLRASNGGKLTLHNGNFTNTGATIEALDGSEVQLSGGNIVGGTLSTSGSGVIRNVFGGATLQNLTLSGLFAHDNSTTITLQGTFTNNGTYQMNSTPFDDTVLSINGDVTLQGSGTVTMSNTLRNKIFGTASTDRLTHAAGHTIQGAGQIGINNLMKLTNHGLIVANETAGITVDPTDGADGVINTGTLRASNGGILTLQNGSFTNTGATIEAMDASEVQLAGANIVGGTLGTSGSGVIRNISDATLQDVTLSGLFAQNNLTTTTLQGTFTNNGTYQMNSTGFDDTYLRINGDVTLQGSGTVTTTNTVRNWILGTAATDRLTNAAGHTIQGAGTIGNNFMALTNRGLIHANQTNPINIDPSGAGFFNEGTLRASGSGGLSINQTGSTFSTSGNVFIDPGSRIDVTGTYTQTGGTTQLNNGLLTATAGVDIQGGMLTGNGTISGNVMNAGTIEPGLSAGQLTINGNLNLLGASALSFELGGLTPGSEFDFIDVNGSASFGGLLALRFINGFQNTVGGSATFTLLTADASIGGMFTNAANGARLQTSDGFGSFQVNYGAGSAFDPAHLVLDSFQQQPALVPEPGTLTLLAAGALCCVGHAWRRRRSRGGADWTSRDDLDQPG
jgi:major membrane immunogen (membrane-anchored lipoprotein)